MSSLLLSVCIPTYNRPQDVKTLLENLVSESEIPDEIVVVDSSEEADTEKTVTTFNAQGKIPVIYFRSPKGLTLQRNNAVNIAKGDIIVFLDDDVLLEKEFIREIKKFFNQYEYAGGAAGVLTNSKQFTAGLGWRLKQKLKIIDSSEPGRFLGCGETTPLPGKELKGVQRVDYLPGGVTAWRKSVFDEFRHSFFFTDYGLGEDKYFSLCVGKKYELYICGSAYAEHFHREGTRPHNLKLGFYNIYNHYFIVRECINASFKHIKFFSFHIIDALNDLLTWPFRQEKKKTLTTGIGRTFGIIWCILNPPGMSEDDPALINRKSLQREHDSS
jgi:glycosyltransferase involved in cell wall biosynthesis